MQNDEVKLLPLNVEWHASTETPPTPEGTNRYYIVAVRRARNAEVYTFPAQHLNGYPLLYGDRGCGGDRTKQCPEDGSHEDGCPTTGWFNEAEGGEYDSTYTPLYMGPGDEFLAWSPIPRFESLSAIPSTVSGETDLWQRAAKIARHMQGQWRDQGAHAEASAVGGVALVFEKMIEGYTPLAEASPANPAETQAVEVGK